MKFLGLERPVAGVTDTAFTPALLEAEARRAWALYADGVIRELYFRADVHEAVLMLECADLEEARRVLATLPLVEAGLIAFDVLPLVPYDGFARLFGAPPP